MTVTLAASDQDAGSTLLIREASKADDAQICAHMRRVVMPGSISLAVSYDPSFFESAEVEGQTCRVLVAERDDKIVGVGLMAKRCVYLNGEPADIGYLSSLRTDPSIRNSMSLARGNRIFQKWHEDFFQAPFYLCSILKENALARRILTSGRAGMPASTDIGTLYTAAIPLLKRPKHRLQPGLRIVRGSDVGADAIIECLNQYGRSKQFFPVYTLDDLLSDDGLMRGLSVDDFHVAIDGERVVGVTACWNQLAFRRIVVAGYTGALRILRPLASPIARLLRLAPLPNVGDAVKSVTAACIAIENNDPHVFKALLNSILHTEYNTGKTFLLVGLMDNDPLMEIVRTFTHLPTRSCIYSLQWDNVDAKLDSRVQYLELGSL